LNPTSYFRRNRDCPWNRDKTRESLMVVVFNEETSTDSSMKTLVSMP
jgi:hypothetical protein